MQRRREARGALVVDSSEPEFAFDERGDVAGVRHAEQTESHRLIEHLMIAANEAVAGLLERPRVPACTACTSAPSRSASSGSSPSSPRSTCRRRRCRST